MPKGKEQLFADFVHFSARLGYGAGYQRDPHQSVPPDCVFLRFRYPGGGLFTSAGIVQFRQREDSFTACKAFVERSDEPMELRLLSRERKNNEQFTCSHRKYREMKA